MECPHCNGETAVITTTASHDRIDRTRRCRRCGTKFTTAEIRSAVIIAALERLSAGSGGKAKAG